MYRQGEEVHVSGTEAKGGSTLHVMRYVLMFSLALVVIAFAIVLALWH